MELEKLLLTREEIVITETERCSFVVPIHPSLIGDLPQSIPQDPSYLLRSIPEAIRWTIKDLQTYITTGEGRRIGTAEKVLRELPREDREYNQSSMISPGFTVIHTFHKNCPYTMAISTNPGLYIDTERISSSTCKFSEEKFAEYRNKRRQTHVWTTHNIDHMPQALFLRNWAIAYHNELLKELHKIQQESD